jgi:hypothetical protein
MTLAQPVDASVDTPRILIHVGGIEGFHTVVDLLMRAGAYGLGGRRFEVLPPLSPGQLEALQELTDFERGGTAERYRGVTVIVEPAGADVWRGDPAAPEPILDDGGHGWWDRNRRASKAGTVTTGVGVQMPLGDDVPFAIEVIKPAGAHTATYRFDGRLCTVTIGGYVNVVGNAASPPSTFSSTYIAPDGVRTEVKLHTMRS